MSDEEKICFIMLYSNRISKMAHQGISDYLEESINPENKKDYLHSLDRIYKNLIGTHIIGPILIRNPELLKLLINRICTQKDENFKYKDITYEDEEEGYELVLKELETRKNKNDRR